MKKIIEIIKKKWLRDTLLTIVLIAIIIGGYIGLNLWVQSINLAPFDFTQEKRYTLSEESKQQVKNVEEEVHIYFFGFSENDTAVSLAKQYSNINEKITAEVVSITQRPDLAQTYGITDESAVGIVVQSSQRYKVLSSNDLYTYDSTTYETIDITEQKLTNAIIDTTIAKKPKIYFLTGHEEYSIDSALASLAVYIQNEVNEVETLNLLTTTFPEDCDTLVIANPTKDFMDNEVEAITKYIQNGGNILWMNDPNIEEVELPNVQKILDLYGIELQKGVIVETDANHMGVSNPYLILPKVAQHDITKDVYNGTGVALPSAGKLEIADAVTLDNLKVTVTPIITNTQTSFYREDFTVSTNSKTASDKEGEFTIAAEASKIVDGEKTSKLVIFANALFATNTKITIQNQYTYAISLANNKDIALNAIAYLTNRGDTIRIRKDTGYVTYTATQSQDNIIRAVIFGFPVIIILAGVVIWQVRRRKK